MNCVFEGQWETAAFAKPNTNQQAWGWAQKAT